MAKRPLFRKLLIANRGEIALRVIRTCRRLGIATVAVYSDADAHAPHVTEADEALRLGSADPSESYLSLARLIGAARRAGADALHPGYGFLSERPELAEACVAAGIVFVGPSAAAMRALGDKIGARRLARRLRVPLAPGYDGDDQSDAGLRREAAALGYPLMIKAAAGGGGRGMRRVDRRAGFAAALAAAQLEAEQAFGDGRLLLERIVEHARHVEVQLLADRFGHALALGDRDCTLQRRHQKVIEEAPAPDLSPALRRSLHRASERLARAAGYQGAGTAEFLVAGTQAYFLELNARLQVEHTVTEAVTGLDLVEWQLRIAAGEPLAIPSAALEPHGHAIQARVYAEDPGRGFLPGGGRVLLVRWPQGPGVRVDASITAAGQEVPASYDPLLAKVICWGETRRDALELLDAELASTAVLGTPSNIAFLRAVLRRPEVERAEMTTDFLDLHPELANAPTPPIGALAAAVRASLGGPAPWRILAGWASGGQRRPVRVLVDEAVYEVDPAAAAPPIDLVAVADPSGAPTWEIAYEGARWRVQFDAPLAPRPDPAAIGKTPVAGDGPPGSAVELSAPGNWLLTAPLSGKLSRVLAQHGQPVAANAPVLALEAMKMQHTVATPRAGRVLRLLSEPGAFVRAGQPLAEIEPAPARSRR